MLISALCRFVGLAVFCAVCTTSPRILAVRRVGTHCTVVYSPPGICIQDNTVDDAAILKWTNLIYNKVYMA